MRTEIKMDINDYVITVEKEGKVLLSIDKRLITDQTSIEETINILWHLYHMIEKIKDGE